MIRRMKVSKSQLDERTQPEPKAGSSVSWQGYLGVGVVLVLLGLAVASIRTGRAHLGTTEPVVAAPPVATNQVEPITSASEPPPHVAATNLSSTNPPSAKGPQSDEDKVTDLINDAFKALGENKLDDALKLCQQAVKLKPDDESGHYDLGIILSRLSRTDEAAKEYSEALRLDPEHSGAHINLGNMLAAQGHLDDAITHLKAAEKTETENAALFNNLGILLAKKGDLPGAQEQLTQALRLQTNYYEARFNLGRILLLQGQVQQATNEFVRVLQESPNYQPARTSLEQVLLRVAGGK